MIDSIESAVVRIEVPVPANLVQGLEHRDGCACFRVIRESIRNDAILQNVKRFAGTGKSVGLGRIGRLSRASAYAPLSWDWLWVLDLSGRRVHMSTGD